MARSILIATVLFSLLASPSPAPSSSQERDLLQRIAQREGRVETIVGFHPVGGGEIQGGPREITTIQDHFLSLIQRSDQDVTRFVDVPYLALDFDLPGLQQALDPNVAASLMTDHNVVLGIGLDRRLRPLVSAAPATSAAPMEDVLDTLDVTPIHTLGYRGEGQTIVVIDTGVEPCYGFLVDAVIWGHDQSAGTIECSVLVEPIDADPDEGAPHGTPESPAHGTQVASVAGGEGGGIPGVAPGARLISILVETEDGEIPTSNVGAALQEVLCKWNTVAGIQIAAVNISLGRGDHPASCDPDPMRPELTEESTWLLFDLVEKLHGDGIPVVVGAGNKTPHNEIAFPACLSRTVAVCGTNNDGETKSTNSKWSDLADLAAPAGYIAIPGTPLDDWLGKGTSISAPFVTGAIALLRQAYPDCSTTEIVTALVDHGRGVTSGTVTLPCIRVAAAFRALDTVCGPPVPPPGDSEDDLTNDPPGPSDDDG